MGYVHSVGNIEINKDNYSENFKKSEKNNFKKF